MMGIHRQRRKIYSSRELLALKATKDPWIIHNMIPRAGRVIVFGQGATFKSTIMFDLCLAVAAERSLFKRIPILKYGTVLVVSTEGSLDMNRSRLLAHARAHAVNPTEIPLFYCQEPFVLDDPSDVIELEQAIKDLKPSLILLDPLDSFFGGDENSAKETKIARRIIDHFIATYGVTFVVIHHEPKLLVKGMKATPRGSSAWQGWADTVLHVERAPESIGAGLQQDVVTVRAVKQRNGVEGEMFAGVPNYNEKLRTVSFAFTDHINHEQIINQYWSNKVFELMQDIRKPMTTAMLAELLGQTPQIISNPLRYLQKEGFIDKNAWTKVTVSGVSTRTVPAWQLTGKVSVVDLAEYMVKHEEAILESELETFFISPHFANEVEPGAFDLAYANSGNTSPICPPRDPTRPGVQPVLYGVPTEPTTNALPS